MDKHASLARDAVQSSVTYDEIVKTVGHGWKKLATFLSHAGRQKAPVEGAFVNPPVARGSTVLFPSIEALLQQEDEAYTHKLVYGAMGNPVQHHLEKILATLEGGTHTQIVNSGLAACTIPLLAFLKSGDHLLLSDSVYGPTRRFAQNTLARFGVETSLYPPMADEETLKSYIRPETRVIFTESPGSHTFEVQDIPMISRVAHAAGARVFLDNTWGIGAFQPFEHGVDVSIQALTKYPVGHADVVIGSITVAQEEDWRTLRSTAIQMGACASADDSWLTLRGLRTMAVRLEKQACSAVELALWLHNRPEVAQVRHPALPGSPGHEFWKRDFKDASGLFAVELVEEYSLDALKKMINRLQVFGIGVSWGGYESLILPSTGEISRSHKDSVPSGVSFRVQVGLEAVEDLKADLEAGFEVLNS